MNIWLERATTYRQLTLGLAIILAVILLGLIGPLFVDVRGAKVGAAPPTNVRHSTIRWGRTP